MKKRTGDKLKVYRTEMEARSVAAALNQNEKTGRVYGWGKTENGWWIVYPTRENLSGKPRKARKVAGAARARKPRHLEYFIDLDERGEFRADVRDGSKTIFDIEGFDIFEDGFMRDQSDIGGLLTYLKDLGVARAGDSLEFGQ